MLPRVFGLLKVDAKKQRTIISFCIYQFSVFLKNPLIQFSVYNCEATVGQIMLNMKYSSTGKR